LRDESLEDTDNLPAPAVIAAEIIEDLEAALTEFALIAEALSPSTETAAERGSINRLPTEGPETMLVDE
jgi:type I restriction enzyme M protein